MKRTSTVRPLAVAAATALALSATPALAHAQDGAGITVGAPGSALVAEPTENYQLCGTAYVGAYDDSELLPVNIPDGAKAISGLVVKGTMDSPALGQFDGEAVTDEHGRYCFQGGPAVGPPPVLDSVLTIDESQIADYNSQTGVGALTKTQQVQGFDTSDPDFTTKSLKYAYDIGGVQYWKFNIAFDEAELPTEPMGSVESASLQFLNLPEILRGMLHGGAMGS